jgi:integrase
MKGKITKRSVDALNCPAGKDREVLWDDALSGFGVVAFPPAKKARDGEAPDEEAPSKKKAPGKKVYVVQYRQAGHSRRSTIGEHGRLTPDEARRLAKVELGAVEGGADPIEERRRDRAVRTFQGVAEDFMARHAKAKRKGSTAEEYARLLRLHVYPVIGSTRIADVSRRDVAKMHGDMSATPAIANKALAVMSSIWGWAARRDEVEANSNPAKGIERYPEERRERFLTAAEFARLGDALREAETVGLSWQVDEAKAHAKHAPKPDSRREVLDPHAVAALRLLVLTGARLREILHLKWSEIDFERGMAFLPDSKTGQKPLYMSAAALAVLEGLPRVEGNAHVIAGQNSGARADLKRPWAAVLRAAELQGVRLHDLRHSFASVGAGASMGLPVIGKLLGHSQPATTARYAHLDADPMRRAADTIGATISAAMDRTSSGEGASNVVSIGGRRS